MRTPALLLSFTLLSPAIAHAQAFIHPGILLDAPALQATREALRVGDPLKTAAMAALRKSPLASLDHVATPFARVECGSFDKPSIGCKPERDDAKAAYTHALLWAYLRDNWDHVNAKLGGNPIIIDRLIGLSLSKFTDTEALDEIEKFFSGVSTKGFDRTLETAKDKIRGRAAYKKRDAEGLKAWLVENGYA